MSVAMVTPTEERDLRKLLAERLEAVGLADADVPALNAAFGKSVRLITKARELTASAMGECNAKIDIIGFGSLARHEFTDESDLDYLVVTYGLEAEPGTTRKCLRHADSLRARLSDNGEFRPPGATGVFGRVISAPDMVERIGLEEDTNHSHTRRILLLEESTSLYRPALHLKLLESIIRRYLYDKVRGRDNVPRFLLNDIVRYWRTITVDYQAKSSTGTTYSLRYLKLLTSRKLTFASAITPLLECQDIDHDSVVQHLVTAYQEPPLLRLLRLGVRLTESEKRHLRCIISLADRFIRDFGQAAWRESVETDCEADDPRDTATFGKARLEGKDLHNHLQEVFLARNIRHFTEKYMIF